MLQVGTRNMSNFGLLQAVGESGKPVLLKRGMTATIEEWLMAAEYIAQRGNLDVVLCERGIRTFEPADAQHPRHLGGAVVQATSHLPVIVDPSHAAGRKDLVVPLSRAAIAVGADGVIVDVHPQPEIGPVRRTPGARRLRPARARPGGTSAPEGRGARRRGGPRPHRLTLRTRVTSSRDRRSQTDGGRAVKHCTHCGHLLGLGRFCTNCGAPVATRDPLSDPIDAVRATEPSEPAETPPAESWQDSTAERPAFSPPPSAPPPQTPPRPAPDPSPPRVPPVVVEPPPPPRFPLFADEVTETPEAAPAAPLLPSTYRDRVRRVGRVRRGCR